MLNEKQKNAFIKALIISAVIIASYILFIHSFRFQRSFTLNISPIPNRYVRDFIDGVHQEESSATYYNWSLRYSYINFPIRVQDSDIICEIRAKRFIKQQAYLYIFANGNRIFIKNIQGKEYERFSFKVPKEYISSNDLEIGFKIFSNEIDRKKGMRLDWIRVTVPEEASILPTSGQQREYLIFLLLNITFFALLGLKFKTKIFLSIIPVVLFLMSNSIIRIETSHLIHYINRWVYAPAIILAIISLTFWKRFGNAKLKNLKLYDFLNINLIFFVSLLTRITGVFYYQYFYPDLRSYFKYMIELEEKGLIGFTYWYSHHHLEILYGFRTPFPYSPMFHVTVAKLNILGLDYIVWLRAFSMILNSVLVLLVYYFIKRIFRKTDVALFGALFFSFSSLVFKRIFLVMYAGLFSTFIVFVAMMLVLFGLNKFEQTKYRWSMLAIFTLALLSYPSGFVNLMMFSVLLVVVLLIKYVPERKFKIKLIKSKELISFGSLAVLGMIIAFSVYYIYYVRPIFTELIPFMLQRSGNISWDNSLQAGLGLYLLKRLIFYLSIPGILLTAPGLYLMKKYKLKDFQRKFLFSWFLSWLVIYILAAPQLLSFVFRLGKEGLFILPLFSAAAGLTCSYYWKKGLKFRVFVVMLFAVYIGLNFYDWVLDIKSFMIFVE